MGISNNKTTILYNEIRSIVTNLSYKKYEWWTKKDNCQKLELLYRDKLLNFEKDNLVKTSYSIGIPIDDNYSKEELCNRIIGHYTRRINLMKTIFDGINKTQSMFNRLREGDICVPINKFVDDWNYCNSIYGAWIGKEQFKTIIKKMERDNKLKIYTNTVNKFETNYYKFLRILKKYLYNIKEDINNSMTDSEFNMLDNKIRQTIKIMIEKCESFYLIATNILVYSPNCLGSKSIKE